MEEQKVTKYKVYDEDSYSKSEFYTTDPYLGLEVQHLRKRSKIGQIFAIIGGVIVFCSLLGCAGLEANDNIYNMFLICLAGTGILLFLIGLIIALPAETKWYKLIYLYEQSDECKRIVKQLDKKRIEKEDEIKKQKAKELVECYDILDDKNKSQEERIELIKKYIKL